MREHRYTVTELDPQRPWVLVGEIRRLSVELEDGQDFNRLSGSRPRPVESARLHGNQRCGPPSVEGGPLVRLRAWISGRSRMFVCLARRFHGGHRDGCGEVVLAGVDPERRVLGGHECCVGNHPENPAVQPEEEIEDRSG